MGLPTAATYEPGSHPPVVDLAGIEGYHADDDLITDEELERKRAEILAEKW